MERRQGGDGKQCNHLSKDQLNTKFCFHITCIVLLISEACIYSSQPGVQTMFHFVFLHRYGFFIKKAEYFQSFQDFSLKTCP